ncbi:pyocin knob domain-containing protein, partial [Glutamicibacter sp. NPDC088455]
GRPGPAGPGVPEGGTAGQTIEKTSNGSTQWVTLTKSKFGLGSVDNTSDLDKPISSATQTALDAKASNIGLASKADLIGGKVPVGQIPVEATVTDSNVSAQVDAPLTGAAIDQRINAQVAPQVEQITADYIAGDQAVIDAAAAAVDANPKIASIEAALPWKGNLADGTDFNTVRTPGIYGVASSTSAATMVNCPFPYRGLLKVWKSAAAVTEHEYAASGSGGRPEAASRITTSATTWTGPWEDRRDAKGILPAGTSLDTFRGAGTHMLIATTAADYPGLPADVTFPFYGVLKVAALSIGTLLASQELKVYLADGEYRVLLRVTKGSIFPAWQEQGKVPAPATGAVDAGLANDLLVQDWSRRMRGRRKVTTATLALRFDHGLANFDSKIRAELESRGYKYSLALCSGQWDRTENVGVTPAMVNGWVTGGLAEIWNHSKDHGSGDNSEAQWKAAILDGLTELRAQLPAAQIDGFAPPGSAGTDFGGFVTGATAEEFFATEGGKFILSNHAVSAGYISGSTRWQDGTVRQGLAHYTLDSYTLAQVQSLVQSVESNKRAIQFMLHPSLLDTAGYITTAEFISILDYVQAEVTAGRLEVVSPYEQLLTDAV